jgi:oligopeptide transport system substrate-binding protein
LGLALGTSGCGKPPTRVSVGNAEQILHYGNRTDPQELDPHIVQGVPSITSCSL